MKNFILAIFAGALVGIGGTIYLACETKFIGALLFSFGLFFVLVYQFKLYTGLVGYALDNDKKTNLNLLIIILGNALGAIIVGYSLRLTRLMTNLETRAIDLVQLKLNDSWLSILILSCFCGLLMYLAVNTFNRAKTQDIKIMALVLAITVFASIGFEHSIANIFYFSMANLWGFKSILYVLIMLIGNGIGSLIIPFVNKLLKISNI